MPETETPPPPEHYLHAEAFIGDIFTEAVGKFADLKFRAVNYTFEQSNLLYDAYQAAMDEGNPDHLGEENLQDALEWKFRAQHETTVAVDIDGDSRTRITAASNFVDLLAGKNQGRGQVSKKGYPLTGHHRRTHPLPFIPRGPQDEDTPLFTKTNIYTFADAKHRPSNIR